MFNNTPEDDFEGYSSSEMHSVLYDTFNEESVIKLNNLSPEDCSKVPIFNYLFDLLNFVKENGTIKLTAKGNLPVKVVKELYHKGCLKEEAIEKGITKLSKEADTYHVHLARILAEISGLTKKVKGKLSLTKKGEKLLNQPAELLKNIFESYTTKFNWGYFDGYENEDIARIGFGFTLILLAKYGNRKQNTQFYAEKYFRAFPVFYQMIKPQYGTVERYLNNCYFMRTFSRFLESFGLVNNTDELYTKSELFAKFIKITKPRDKV